MGDDGITWVGIVVGWCGIPTVREVAMMRGRVSRAPPQPRAMENERHPPPKQDLKPAKGNDDVGKHKITKGDCKRSSLHIN